MSAETARDAEHWRRLEAQARTIAAGMTDAEPKRMMLFIAEGYKLLADRAEFRKTQQH
jgi:plasmid stability protein